MSNSFTERLQKTMILDSSTEGVIFRSRQLSRLDRRIEIEGCALLLQRTTVLLHMPTLGDSQPPITPFPGTQRPLTSCGLCTLMYTYPFTQSEKQRVR